MLNHLFQPPAGPTPIISGVWLCDRVSRTAARDKLRNPNPIRSVPTDKSFLVADWQSMAVQKKALAEESRGFCGRSVSASVSLSLSCYLCISVSVPVSVSLSRWNNLFTGGDGSHWIMHDVASRAPAMLRADVYMYNVTDMFWYCMCI